MRNTAALQQLLKAEPSGLAEVHAHPPALDISMKLIQE